MKQLIVTEKENKVTVKKHLVPFSESPLLIFYCNTFFSKTVVPVIKSKEINFIL